MAGISFFELVIIFLIGLIVLGPERLPRVASQLGSWLGQARRMTRAMKRQLEEELNLEREMSIHPRPAAPTLPAKPPVPADDNHPAADGPESPGTGVADDAAGGETAPAALPGEDDSQEKARGKAGSGRGA